MRLCRLLSFISLLNAALALSKTSQEMGHINPLHRIEDYSCAINTKLNNAKADALIEDTGMWERAQLEGNIGCVLKETMFRIPTARIVWVNYKLLKADFPSLATKENPEIDELLLSEVAYISDFQVKQTKVNSPIPIARDETRFGYRPPTYGRATVMKFQVDGQVVGLMDVKGVGAHPYLTMSVEKVPFLKIKAAGHAGHSDGLLKLAEAIREGLYEQLVKYIFLHAGVDLYTAGTYAIIDAGFDVLSQKGDRDRAGIYVRQAHDRINPFDPTWEGNAFPRMEVRQAAADLLEIYGLTVRRDLTLKPEDERRLFKMGKLIDGVNIQTTRDERGIMDFGHYTAYHRDALSDPEVEIDLTLWGYHGTNVRDGFNYSSMDRPSTTSYDLSRALVDTNRHEQWNQRRDWVHEHFENFLKPAREKLDRAKDDDGLPNNRRARKHLPSFLFKESERLRWSAKNPQAPHPHQAKPTADDKKPLASQNSQPKLPQPGTSPQAALPPGGTSAIPATAMGVAVGLGAVTGAAAVAVSGVKGKGQDQVDGSLEFDYPRYWWAFTRYYLDAESDLEAACSALTSGEMNKASLLAREANPDAQRWWGGVFSSAVRFHHDGSTAYGHPAFIVATLKCSQ